MPTYHTGTLGVFHLLTWLSTVLGPENIPYACWTIEPSLKSSLIWWFYERVFWFSELSFSYRFLTSAKVNFVKLQWTSEAEKSGFCFMTRGQIAGKICLALCLFLHTLQYLFPLVLPDKTNNRGIPDDIFQISPFI